MIRRIFPFVLILAGAMLLVLAAASLFASQAAEDSGDIPLPEQLAGLRMARRASGSSAIDEINQLHGKDFALTSGAVGVYGDNQATLWVSGSPSRQAASQLVNEMAERIAAGNSPFTALGTRTVGKRLIYALDGLGQRHFYFQARERAVWLAADPALAEQALQETLKFYPD